MGEDVAWWMFVKKSNDRKNNLKQNGLIPAKIEIDDSKATASLFFKDNTQIVFGFDFETVSLAQLISDQAVKNYVLAAEGLLAKSNYKEAIISVAKAYYTLESVQRAGLSKGGSHNFWERELFYMLPEMTTKGEWFIQSPFDNAEMIKIDETLLAINHMYRQNFGLLSTAISNMTLG